MKTAFVLLMSAIAFINSATCGGNINKETRAQNDMETNTGIQQIKITVGSKTFTAALLDSPTAAAFKALLPLTIKMNELNGNEKYFDLPNSLPTKASNPKTIQNGDLMLYGSNTLVLFYENFNTSYSYTRLGSIDNPSGLAEALGSGKVTITFEAP